MELNQKQVDEILMDCRELTKEVYGKTWEELLTTHNITYFDDELIDINFGCLTCTINNVNGYGVISNNMEYWEGDYDTPTPIVIKSLTNVEICDILPIGGN